MKSLTFLMAALSLSPISAPALATTGQEAAGDQITLGREYLLTSKLTGRPYRIYVQIPRDPPPPQGYPIFYLFDGNLQYPVAAATERLRAFSKEIPQSVVIGIGYPDLPTPDVIRMRWEDLSLPAPAEELPPQPRTLHVNPGGLDNFLRFVDEEVKPFVEARVPVNKSCQALFGHSLGGLAVLRELFAHPLSYQAYVAASPAIWWNNRAVLKDEASFVSRVSRDEVTGRLLLTAGGLEEDTTPWRSNPDIVARLERNRQVHNVIELADRLKRAQNDHFQIESYVFPDETHTSVIPTAISRGLKFGLNCQAK